MQNRAKFKLLPLALLGCLSAFALSGPAAAQHAGGGGGHSGGGGGHAGGAGHGGGGVIHGGGGYTHGGYRGGYGGYRGGYGGYRGGYYGGYRGYYGGWRGGYGYGGWGWGGVGLGLYFATLPLYYSTLWWQGVPYYYADNVYYTYDTNVGQYQTVAPPAEVQSQVSAESPAPAAADGAPSVGTDLMAYPKNGQSAEQQSKDKYECHHWAATQTGFDPTQGAGASSVAGKRADYMRAQAACLDGRGYSVR